MRRINEITHEYTIEVNDKWLGNRRNFYEISKNINGAIRKFMQEYDMGRYDIILISE